MEGLKENGEIRKEEQRKRGRRIGRGKRKGKV